MKGVGLEWVGLEGVGLECVGLEDVGLGRVKDWKSVGSEECRIGRV